MLHKDKIVIQKVVSEIEIGTELLGNTSYENFISNEMLKRAICMTVVNIGELVKSLDDSTRTAYPKILWKDIAGMRDIVVHNYETIDKMIDKTFDGMPIHYVNMDKNRETCLKRYGVPYYLKNIPKGDYYFISRFKIIKKS